MKRMINIFGVNPLMQAMAGDIVLVDSTNFTTLFGGTKGLETFWRNLAAMR
jgi:hypothetical protein